MLIREGNKSEQRSNVRYAFSTSQLVHSKGFVSGSPKISNGERSIDCCVHFESIIQGQHLFNISALK